jgi:hypothetical protein
MFSGPAAALGKCGCKDLFQPIGRDDERVHECPVAPGKVAGPGEVGVECCVQPLVPGRLVLRRRDTEKRLRFGIKGDSHPREEPGAGLERPDHALETGVAHATGALQSIGIDPVQGREEIGGVPGNTVRRDRDHERLLPHRRRTEVRLNEIRIVHPEPERALDIKPCDGIQIPGLGSASSGMIE